MAEKKQTQSKSQSSSKSNETQLPKETLEQLNEHEKNAIQSMQGEDGDKYRLKNPNTQYTDPITGWTVTGDQAKELPKNVAAETYARIKEGFLIKAEK